MESYSKTVPNRSMVALAIVLAVFTLLPAAGALAAEEGEEPAGKAVFLAHKCNLCHSVPSAGIESKTKSEKMKGSDLGGPIEAGFEAFATYVRQQGELDGKSHKKEFKGTDEELQAIFDWLTQLEPVASSDTSR